MTELERAIDTPDEDEAAAKGAGAPSRRAQPDGSAPDAAPDVPDVPDASEEATEAVEPAETGEAASPAPAAADRGDRRIPLLLAVAAFAYVLDLVSKLIVVAKLEHQGTVELIGSLLRLEVVRNRGAAFGFGEALTVVLTAIAVVVIAVIARIARTLYSAPWAVALGMLLGGAFGNLTDRVFRSPGVFRGAVVDFIAPTHFAVFNFADSAIVCGGVLIVLLSFRGLDPDGTVHRD